MAKTLTVGKTQKKSQQQANKIDKKKQYRCYKYQEIDSSLRFNAKVRDYLGFSTYA